MEYVASFHLTKLNNSYFVGIKGLRRDGKMLPFLVDTGASISLVGLNTISDRLSDRKLLKEITKEAIQQEHITAYSERFKTVTAESIEVYPCKCSGISVSDTLPITLYFGLFLGDITLPLLGFDYLDDCTYHHSIGGDLLISAVAKDIGKRFYPDNVLDFNSILDSYEAEIVRKRQ